MSQTVRIKQGDVFPDAATQVKDENGVVVNLAGATCTFSMRSSRDPSVLVIDAGAGTLVDGPNGRLGYAWLSGTGETDEPGTYEGEFLVTPGSGDPFRVPTEGYITIIIEEAVS